MCGTGAVLLAATTMRAHADNSLLVCTSAAAIVTCLLAIPQPMDLINNTGDVYDARWHQLKLLGFPEALSDALDRFPPVDDDGRQIVRMRESIKRMQEDIAKKVARGDMPDMQPYFPVKLV